MSIHFTPSHHERVRNLRCIGTYRVTNAIAKFVKIRQTFLKVISGQNVILLAVCPYSANGKAVPLQAWAGPGGSQEVKVPRFRNNGTGWW